MLKLQAFWKKRSKLEGRMPAVLIRTMGVDAVTWREGTEAEEQRGKARALGNAQERDRVRRQCRLTGREWRVRSG